MFERLAGNNYFTTLDLKAGYHQIKMADDSKKFTAFVTPDGHFQYNRVSFGLCNAPAIFQR
ncbi:reverse transcriptase family protein, partial [Acinetobacter baumannii]|uniref:reverse transcriptase family protein n=1 Tax=Acinetobacter baumannii TaxID=470 RepID=UPI001C07A451